MAIDQVDRTVVSQEPATGQQAVRTETRHSTRSGPGASEMSRRIIVLVFGLIQVVIGARFVLLLLEPAKPTASCRASSTSASCSWRRSTGSFERTPSTPRARSSTSPPSSPSSAGRSSN